jgi:hypothetical protein
MVSAGVPAECANRSARVRSGCSPGVMIRCGQSREPGATSFPDLIADSTPARATDDFPTPERPTIATGPASPVPSASRARILATSRSRPKK